MDPARIKRWSRRLIVAVVLILGLLGGGVVLANTGIGEQAADVIDRAADAMDTFFETF